MTNLEIVYLLRYEWQIVLGYGRIVLGAEDRAYVPINLLPLVFDLPSI